MFLPHRSSALPAREPRRVSVQWTAYLAVFSCRQWFIDSPRLSLTSNQEIYCRWWTAWGWQHCVAMVGYCFGHREAFHLIFKNGNFSTDLFLEVLLEVAKWRLGRFLKLRYVEWQQLEYFFYTNRTLQALQRKLSSPPSQEKYWRERFLVLGKQLPNVGMTHTGRICFSSTKFYLICQTNALGTTWTWAQLGGGHGGHVPPIFQTLGIYYAMSPTFSL